MVRPSYPPCYQEREVRKIEANQAPLVVVHGSWQVGDLVDWDRDGCFWCVTVLTVKRNEPFQVHTNQIGLVKLFVIVILSMFFFLSLGHLS